MMVGDVVLLVENEAPRNEWPVGIVCEAESGTDGLVRKVKLKIYRSNRIKLVGGSVTVTTFFFFEHTYMYIILSFMFFCIVCVCVCLRLFTCLIAPNNCTPIPSLFTI